MSSTLHKRRKLLISLVAAALLPALPARAQKTFRVGVLGPVPHADDKSLEVLRNALRDLGYVEGKNLTIEYRGVPPLAVDAARLQFVQDLLAAKVDVIIASATRNAIAARNVTTTVPIVMVNAGDPVEIGLVTSLDKPGGNVTGISRNATELAVKDLELLLDTLPGCTRVGILANPSNPLHPKMIVGLRRTARARNLSRYIGQVFKAEELPHAISAMSREKVNGMLVLVDGLFYTNRKLITELVAAQRLPAIYQSAFFVDAGGLMSYAPDNLENYRVAAGYVDKILKGARPSELPIQEPPRLELAVNLKTARALGITIPPMIMRRADKVID